MVFNVEFLYGYLLILWAISWTI